MSTWHWSAWLVAALATLRSGWMTFDGMRALTVGDYVTPGTGPHAGRLGPWSAIVDAVGIDPRGTPMKVAFVMLGAAGLAATVAFLLRASWGWAAMVVTAAAALWYLPFGTALSVAQLGLLVLVPALRR